MNIEAWHKRQSKRLEILSKNNSKINIQNHKKDFELCQSSLCERNIKEFEELLEIILKRLERYLKYNRKRLNIGDDHSDIFGVVSETITKCLHNFRGGSLLSTWVRGITRYKLLVYYFKKRKLQEHELKENTIISDNCINPINAIIEKETFGEYFSALSKNETYIFNAIYQGYSLKELSKKLKVPLCKLIKIHDSGKNKIEAFARKNKLLK